MVFYIRHNPRFWESHAQFVPPSFQTKPHYTKSSVAYTEIIRFIWPIQSTTFMILTELFSLCRTGNIPTQRMRVLFILNAIVFWFKNRSVRSLRRNFRSYNQNLVPVTANFCYLNRKTLAINMNQSSILATKVIFHEDG